MLILKQDLVRVFRRYSIPARYPCRKHPFSLHRFTLPDAPFRIRYRSILFLMKEAMKPIHGLLHTSSVVPFLPVFALTVLAQPQPDSPPSLRLAYYKKKVGDSAEGVDRDQIFLFKSDRFVVSRENMTDRFFFFGDQGLCQQKENRAIRLEFPINESGCIR